MKTNDRLKLAILAATILLSACGSGSNGDSASQPIPDVPVIPGPVVVWPQNDNGLRAALRDTNGETLSVSGKLNIKIPETNDKISQYELYWIDAITQEIQGERILIVLPEELDPDLPQVEISESLLMPNEDAQLILITKDSQGETLHSDIINFLDFSGNALLSGKGGTALKSWVYGEDRDFLFTHLETINGTDFCSFDNGLVMVVDMENERDQREAITADDILYPAYSFDCSESLIHNGKPVFSIETEEDDVVVTYSALNDALHYATVTHDMFFKYLGRPPFADKMRLRVHYGSDFSSAVFWDGEYANFGDELFSSSYGSVGLDILAHELGHGFLNFNSQLTLDFSNYTKDALTLHEAFGDLTAAAAVYFYTGELHWLHGEETQSPHARDASKIITEEGATPSHLDYDPAQVNQYLSIGFISYPFFLLTEKWDINRSYAVFLDAAQYCWAPTLNFTQAAQCVLESAENKGEAQQDVIDAFKTVKIKLFDEGTLAHFDFEFKKQVISFSDTSVSTSQASNWHWDFGDGHTSDEQNPVHEYAQGGLYEPVVTVTDVQGDIDSYSRPVDVFSEYCVPSIGSYGRAFNQVSINDTVIDTSIDYGQYDYTQSVIQVTDINDIHIRVEGEEEKNTSHNWVIWLDANDDGVFDDSQNSAEILYDATVDKGNGYGLDTNITLPNNTDTGPLRLRISGDFSFQSPCNTRAVSSIDVLIEVP
ncbi:MAG: PKD domain-containing protein [Bermanella sp.]